MTRVEDLESVIGLALRPSVIAMLLVVTLRPLALLAQEAESTTPERSPISIGVSGLPARHGPIVRVDAMLVSGISFGLQVVSQSVGPSTRVTGAAVMLGAEITKPGWRWLRMEMGLGGYGQRSTGALRWLERAGIGGAVNVTAAAFRNRMISPELHGWVVLATNVQFAGASAGLRVPLNVLFP